MYHNMNEDVAWQRVQDLQREMENSRLLATHGASALGRLVSGLAGRIRKAVRAARPARQADSLSGERDSASDAA